MRVRTVRRGGLIGLIAAASLVVGTLPASAAAGDGTAFGLSADIELFNQPIVTVPPTPVADADGDNDESLASIVVLGLLETGLLEAHAMFEPATGEVNSSASVADIGLTGHLPGSIGLIAVQCSAVQSGIYLSAQLIDVDFGTIGKVSENPDPNTVIELGWDDLTAAGAPAPEADVTTGPVVRLIINEQYENADGSKTVNGLHIELLAAPLGTGDVIIASATCGPADLPVPLASGAGLWLSLGLLGLAIVPVAVVLRRRQALAASA